MRKNDPTPDEHRSPYVPNESAHPWRRMVAIGDSFTEGIGDPIPGTDGHRGWADRVAEVLGSQVDDFAYANLAVRGKLIGQIVADQIEPALALNPDLVTFSAGGNDVIRPGGDPDVVAAQFEDAVARLSSQGATVVVFTGIDTNFTPVFRGIRGRVAIYNENIRGIADRYDAIVADQWALKEAQDMRFFDDDRLHYNALGHHEVARMVLRTLNVPNDLQPMQPDPLPTLTWRAARANDLVWARTHLVPWVLRRVRHQSSGDNITAKRPDALPMIPSENSGAAETTASGLPVTTEAPAKDRLAGPGQPV
ncbi:SGNH/GDSL hydrolase family protein [Microbacterium sp. bgisy203]|uniref:SGNH/GDSL hydrolase family protein n=1 Tax=Microbacterium sp. bgisy203 TaxID=3413799 RepID=UPI003D729EE7